MDSSSEKKSSEQMLRASSYSQVASAAAGIGEGGGLAERQADGAGSLAGSPEAAQLKENTPNTPTPSSLARHRNLYQVDCRCRKYPRSRG